ncbi:MAG: type III-B CRISPR module RAMP protein Cmr6 [Betaproteobacteria bacterium]|nr:type III-B CRISPR module RAMP protein Cmr6 [Betaproteobacteria bacterium]
MEYPSSRGEGNAGLWYDKFCNQWCRGGGQGLAAWSLKSFVQGQGSDAVTVNPKLDWIQQMSRSPVGEETLIREARNRHARLLEARGCKPLFFQTDWRFVTGLGREHPVENGFAWHHGLGVPYLPGSSVKGMVRAWAEQWEPADRSMDADRIFGPRGKPGELPPSTGSVVFLDALPVKRVKLDAEVMTPHYAPWYQDGSGSQAPGDWHSPTPIPFLVVAPETTFQFGMLPRRTSDVADKNLAAGWLADALAFMGAGAKTAVGYGRMSADTTEAAAYRDEREQRERKHRQDEAARLVAAMTPGQQMIHAVGTAFEDPRARFLPDLKAKVLGEAASLLKTALKWTDPGEKSEAAALLEKVFEELGSKKVQKRAEWQQAIATLRGG